MVRVAGPIGLPVLRFGIRSFEPGWSDLGAIREPACRWEGWVVRPFFPVYPGHCTVADDKETGSRHHYWGLRTTPCHEAVWTASTDTAAADLSCTV